MSPRSAALVSTTSAVDGGSLLTRQRGTADGPAAGVLEQALTVGAAGWTQDHRDAAQQRQVEALAATRPGSLGVLDAPVVSSSTAGAVLAAPLALGQPSGSPTAAENAAIDALFDQAAQINVALLALVLVAVAGVLAVVLTHL